MIVYKINKNLKQAHGINLKKRNVNSVLLRKSTSKSASDTSICTSNGMENIDHFERLSKNISSIDKIHQIVIKENKKLNNNQSSQSNRFERSFSKLLFNKMRITKMLEQSMCKKYKVEQKLKCIRGDCQIDSFNSSDMGVKEKLKKAKPLIRRSKCLSREKSLKFLHVDYLKKYKNSQQDDIKFLIGMEHTPSCLCFQSFHRCMIIYFHERRVVLFPDESDDTRNIYILTVFTNRIIYRSTERYIVHTRNIKKIKYSNFFISQMLTKINFYDISHHPLSQKSIPIVNSFFIISSQQPYYFNSLKSTNFLRNKLQNEYFPSSSNLTIKYERSLATRQNPVETLFVSSKKINNNIYNLNIDDLATNPSLGATGIHLNCGFKKIKALKSAGNSEIIINYPSTIKVMNIPVKIFTFVEFQRNIPNKDMKIIYKLIPHECNFKVFSNTITVSFHCDMSYHRPFSELRNEKLIKIGKYKRNYQIPNIIKDRRMRILKIMKSKNYGNHSCEICGKLFCKKINLKYHFRCHKYMPINIKYYSIKTNRTTFQKEIN